MSQLLVEEDDFAVDTSTNKQIVAPKEKDFYQRLADTGMASRLSGIIGHTSWGGYNDYDEMNDLLQPFTKYNTYYNQINKTPVLGACVQTFLETVGSSQFNLIPSKHDTDGMVKDFFEEVFFRDCRTPFRKVVQHAATAKLYGFEILTWNWRLRSDGRLTLDQIRHLPQHTIVQYLPKEAEVPNWIVQSNYWSTENSIVTDKERYVPYWKCIHIVEDVVRNTRTGDGLLRRVIEECYNYHALKAIQKFGFERALRGVLKFRAPREMLADTIRSQVIAAGNFRTDDEIRAEVKKRLNSDLDYETIFAEAIRQNKLQAHIRMDSSVVVHRDDKGGDRPVATPKFDAEFMDTKSDPAAHDIIKQEIDATEFRIAEVFGLEATQLGKGGSSGTYNLSVDKTDNFRLRLESTLDMIADALYSGVIVPFGMANGIDEMKLPKFNTEIIRPKNPEEQAKWMIEFEKAGYNKADPGYIQWRANAGIHGLTAEQTDHAKKLQEAKFKAELEMPDAELEQAKQAGKPKEPMANAKERGDPPKGKPVNARQPNKR